MNTKPSRLSTADLYGQLFDRRLRGYDPDAVDRLIERVRAELQRRDDEQAALVQENTSLRVRLGHLDAGTQAEIVTAQAVSIIKSAQRQAEHHLGETEEQCRRMTSEARAYHQEILHQAQERADAVIAAAERTANNDHGADSWPLSEDAKQRLVAYLRSLAQAARTQLRTMEEAVVRDLEDELAERNEAADRR
jgi:DivIVA domain-containing protein